MARNGKCSGSGRSCKSGVRSRSGKEELVAEEVTEVTETAKVAEVEEVEVETSELSGEAEVVKVAE